MDRGRAAWTMGFPGGLFGPVKGGLGYVCVFLVLSIGHWGGLLNKMSLLILYYIVSVDKRSHSC